MGPEALYAELKQLAEKLQVNVSEQNLRTTGIKAKSGLCIVKGQNVFIMDKHKPLRKKTKLPKSLHNISYQTLIIYRSGGHGTSRCTPHSALRSPRLSSE